MPTLISNLTRSSAIAALLLASLAMPSVASTASAADVEVGEDGADVRIDTDEDHYKRYHRPGDDRFGRYEEDRVSEPYQDRYNSDSEEDSVDVEVPGAEIDVD